MRLLYTLLIVVALPAALIWMVGYYATYTSKVSMYRTVKDDSDAQARSLMDEIERVIAQHVANWQAYGTTDIVQATLRASGQELDAIEELNEYIREQDQAWSDADSDLARQLSENALSQELSSFMSKLNSTGDVYGEVFVTNKHGVNAAQSSRTSNYFQKGESWWQAAWENENGVFVSDVRYDESAGITALELCVRIDDAQGQPLGVLKAVLNIEEIFELIDTRAKAMGPDYTSGVILFDRNLAIIHESNARDEDDGERQNLADTSQRLSSGSNGRTTNSISPEANRSPWKWMAHSI
jgi:hypothetical protein